MSASNFAKRIIPLLDRVLVKRVIPETKTSSGILLPEQAQSKLNQGIVVATGQGVHRDGKLVPTQVKVGDKVLLPEYMGNTLKLGSDKSAEDYALFRDDDILAIIKD